MEDFLKKYLPKKTVGMSWLNSANVGSLTSLEGPILIRKGLSEPVGVLMPIKMFLEMQKLLCDLQREVGE